LKSSRQEWSSGLTNILLPNTIYAYTLSGPGYEQMGNASGHPYVGGQVVEIPAAGGAVTFGTNDFDATFDVSLVPEQVGTASVVLSVQAIPGSRIVLGWSAGTLQGTTNLVPANWQPVSGATPPFYTNSTTASQMFYRVHP
jgi:hypothetical protein